METLMNIILQIYNQIVLNLNSHILIFLELMYGHILYQCVVSVIQGQHKFQGTTYQI